jgi:hypothetical protein
MRTDPVLKTAFERSYSDQLVEAERAATPEAAALAALGPAPAPAAEPRLSLVDHAMLAAEIALQIDAPERLLARRGLTPEAKHAVDEYYRAVVHGDPQASATWQAAFEQARQHLARRR